MSCRFAVLAALLLALAAPALAQLPCDAMPTTSAQVVRPAWVEDVLCDLCGSGAPAPGRRAAGVGIDYVDGKRWECELYRGNSGTGDCKRLTICKPGGERFFDNGIYRCRYPAVVVQAPNAPANPQDDCYRKLNLEIRSLKNMDGLDLTGSTLRKPGPVKVLVGGPGVANARNVSMDGGVRASFGNPRNRVHSNPRANCLAPDCVVVDFDLSGATEGGHQLTLSTVHQYRQSSVRMLVDKAYPPPGQMVVPHECQAPSNQSTFLRLVVPVTTRSPNYAIQGNRLERVAPYPVAPGQPIPFLRLGGWGATVSPATVVSLAGPWPISFTWTAPALKPPPKPPMGGVSTPTYPGCIFARIENGRGELLDWVAVPIQ